MEFIDNISNLLKDIPLSDPEFLKNMGLVCAVVLVLGLLFRLFFGKHSNLNHVLSAVISILLLYIFAIVLYHTDIPLKCPLPTMTLTLDFKTGLMLETMPFVRVEEDQLKLFAFGAATLQELSMELLRMIVLAFFINLLDKLLDDMLHTNNILLWFLLRVAAVAASFVIQSVLYWLFSFILPGVVFEYAPLILLLVVLSTLVMGLLQMVLGVALTAVCAPLGLLYHFMFKTDIGQQISNAILTTLLLWGFVTLLQHLGYAVLSISALSFLVLLPIIGMLLVLWYLVDMVL